MTISKEDMKILLKSQQGELDAVLMYQSLADVVNDKMCIRDRYVRVGKTWNYICLIIDLNSREIIGYSSGKNLSLIHI